MKQRRAQAGFTLVELMIVVTIIGILAAVAIPRYVNYMRSSQTAEVADVGGIMVTAMQAYADQQSLTPSLAAALFSGMTLVPGSPTTGTLAAVLPDLNLPPNSTFNYTVSALVATAGPQAGDVAYCITAVGTTNAGIPNGIVLFSSAPAMTSKAGAASASVSGGWTGQVYNVPYVTGSTTLNGAVAGGYCTATGAAQATQS